MNLSLYEQLTGLTVSDDEQSLVLAQIRRSQKILEGMLGFTLDPLLTNTNIYNESGKTSSECSCPDVDLEDLEEPDEVITAYRLFSYNPNDKFFHVDPFTQVHQVKLVWNNVTIKTFNSDEFRANFANGWGKFIENCQHNICVCSCTDCVQLAVDADWLFACDSTIGDSSVGCVNDEILYIWADMITFYADCKRDIKSESIGSHSYTRFADAESGREGKRLAPENQENNLAILKKYAGPAGTLTKVIVP